MTPLDQIITDETLGRLFGQQPAQARAHLHAERRTLAQLLAAARHAGWTYHHWPFEGDTDRVWHCTHPDRGHLRINLWDGLLTFREPDQYGPVASIRPTNVADVIAFLRLPTVALLDANWAVTE